MSMGEAFKKALLESKKDYINSLPKEERLPYVEELYRATETAPVFNQQAEVTPETQAELEGAMSNYHAQVERLQRSSGWDEETLRQRGAISETPDEMYGIGDIRKTAELESMGVDTRRELPGGIADEVKLGFGAETKSDLRNVLSKHFGKDVVVAEYNGDYVYINPNDKQLVRANFGPIAKAGHGIPMAADIGGTYLIGGTSPQGMVMKTVAKETLGSGAFTTLGELARLGIGSVAGVHGLTFKEAMGKALKEGALAAAGTGVMGTGAAAIKGLDNFIKGGIYTPEEAAKHGFNADEFNKAADIINEELKRAGKKGVVKGTLAQKAGDDVHLSSAQAELMRTDEYAQEFADRAASDQAATRTYLDTINQPEMKPYAGTDDITDVAKQRISHRVEQAKVAVADKRAELSKELDSITDTWKTEVGKPTAAILEAKKEVSDQATKQMWANIRAGNGYDEANHLFNIDVPYGERSAELKKIFARRASTAQTRLESGGIHSMYKEAAEDAKGYSTEHSIRGQKRAAEGKQDLADLNHEISTLRHEYADALKGGRNAVRTRELRMMRDALVEDRRLALIKGGREDLLKAIEAAEEQTLKHNEAYVRSVVGDLLEKNENGIPLIKRSGFVDNMLGRDEEDVIAFKNIIADDMELTDQWRKGMLDAWKKTAFGVDGKYNEKAAREWVKGKMYVLKHFLGKEDIDKLARTADLANIVHGGKVTSGGVKRGTILSRLDQFKKRADEKFGTGALASADKDGIVKLITGGKSWATPAGRGVETVKSKIQFARNMTADHPAAWQAVQNDFKKAIQKDLVDVKTGHIKPAKIAEWVNDPNKAEIIKEALGSKYYEQLSNLNYITQRINQKATVLAEKDAVKGLIQTVRATMTPPLTRRGRAFTAIVHFQNGAAKKSMAKALLDESTMKDIADLAEHNPNTRRFLEKAVSLGLIMPDENFDEDN